MAVAVAGNHLEAAALESLLEEGSIGTKLRLFVASRAQHCQSLKMKLKTSFLSTLLVKGELTEITLLVVNEVTYKIP